MPPINIRLGKVNDINLVMSTWLKGFRGSPRCRNLPNDIYNFYFREAFNRMLMSPETRLSVACDPEEIDIIYGYLIHQGDKCHWLYVKADYRNCGLAKKLFQFTFPNASIESPVKCTNRTESWESLSAKYPIVKCNWKIEDL